MPDVASRDAVEVADLKVDRDFRVEALAGGGNADLAQLVRHGLGQGDAVDVVLVADGLGEAVDVGDAIVGGRHADRAFGERVEAFEGRFLLGVEGVVDDVVEDAAHRGGLVCLDLADDLQFGVFVGPLELVLEAGGGLHLEAFADDRGEGFLVAGLLRAFGDDLGF